MKAPLPGPDARTACSQSFPMFLSLATTHRPATDLGFLLHKHPGRVHETELSFGKAVLFYTETTEDRCEAALMIDVDPVGAL